MKKFSFVILSYGNNLKLISMLKSLNYQGYYSAEDYEAIVVDISENLSAGRAIKNLNVNYDLHYTFLGKSQNINILTALNCGWISAKGEIIIFLSTDVTVKNDYLFQVNKCHSISSRLVAIGVSFIKLASGKQNRVIETLELKNLISRFSYNISHCKYPWFLVPISNISIQKNWLQKVNGFFTGFKDVKSGFIDIGYRLCNEGAKIILNSNMESIYQSMIPVETGDNIYFYNDPEDILYLYDRIKLFDIRKNDLINILEQNEKGMELLYHRNLISFRILISFINRDKLQDLKAEIINSRNNDNTEVIVYDFIEDTDLETWIQIIGKGPCAPRYYPVSKIIYSDAAVPMEGIKILLL